MAKGTAKKGKAVTEEVPSVAVSLHKISKQLSTTVKKQKAHELADDLRFGAIDKTLSNQPTKNDLSTTHQEILNVTASKEDVQTLSDKLIDEDGQPKFATKADMEPILNLYKGSTFVKSLFAGGGAFLITLVAVGYAIIQIISWIRGTPH